MKTLYTLSQECHWTDSCVRRETCQSATLAVNLFCWQKMMSITLCLNFQQPSQRGHNIVVVAQLVFSIGAVCALALEWTRAILWRLRLCESCPPPAVPAAVAQLPLMIKIWPSHQKAVKYHSANGSSQCAPLPSSHFTFWTEMDALAMEKGWKLGVLHLLLWYESECLTVFKRSHTLGF